ncbi:SCO family protein [Sporosarcina sp. G11-34]|uniref:SCO family protein n=1 Tax=Sporosarcina sp. G11-34 TaxID=2849605 RepID=UPI0022A96170|nr:SCO family protein [Sporosarcina sp. G11-34]MCZ2258167.1 SCO family protein [Sporosarcina sp. G11-34]
MRKLFVLPYVLLIILVLGACSSGGFKADHKYEIEPFEFTNQNNEKVSLDDLKGQVWLSQFVFTNCTTVCGPMMFHMAELQDQLIKNGVEDYKLVSFSVDPKNDTPEVLQEYLNGFATDPEDTEKDWDESKWEMLTGYTQEEIADISLKSFKMPVFPYPDSSPEAGQVLHGVLFSLVNQEGQVVKSYNGNEDVPFDQIVKDMKALIKSGS